MLAERYLRRRYREGRREGRLEGRQEGRQETLDLLREVAADRRIDDDAIDGLIRELVRNQNDHGLPRSAGAATTAGGSP